MICFLLRQTGAVPSTKAVGGGISVVCLTRTSRYRSKRRSWLVPLLPTFILSWLLEWSRITQARFSGQGQNSGRVGRGSGNGRGQGRGRGTGYTSKPKTRTKSWAWDGAYVKAQDIYVVYYQGPIEQGAMVLMIAAGQGTMPWIGLLK